MLDTPVNSSAVSCENPVVCIFCKEDHEKYKEQDRKFADQLQPMLRILGGLSKLNQTNKGKQNARETS